MAENPLDRVLRLAGQSEDLIRLTRHVRTPAGALKYHKPVGAELSHSDLSDLSSGTWIQKHSDLGVSHHKKNVDGSWSPGKASKGRTISHAQMKPWADAGQLHMGKQDDNTPPKSTSSMMDAYNERIKREAERNARRTAKEDAAKKRKN